MPFLIDFAIMFDDLLIPVSFARPTLYIIRNNFCLQWISMLFYIKRSCLLIFSFRSFWGTCFCIDSWWLLVSMLAPSLIIFATNRLKKCLGPSPPNSGWRPHADLFRISFSFLFFRIAFWHPWHSFGAFENIDGESLKHRSHSGACESLIFCKGSAVEMRFSPNGRSKYSLKVSSKTVHNRCSKKRGPNYA